LSSTETHVSGSTSWNLIGTAELPIAMLDMAAVSVQNSIILTGKMMEN